MSDPDAPLPAERLYAVVHAQAHALMLAQPSLTPEAAVALVARLAVTVYDRVTLEAALRKAAAECGVPASLADVVAGSGGASAALT